MTLRDESESGGWVKQMLLGLYFCMTPHDERGGMFNQMLLQLCFCMTLHDERGGRGV